MKTPFFIPALGFTAGILLRSCLESFEATVLWGIFLLQIGLLWLLRGRRGFALLLLGAFISLGILFSRADHQRPKNAVEKWAGVMDGPLWIEGRLIAHPEIKRNEKKENVSLVISAVRLSCRAGHGYRRWPVTGKVQVFLLHPPVVFPEAGDRVRIFGRLELPKPAMNPGGFDYAKYLGVQSIFCVFNGYGKNSLKIIKKAEASQSENLIFLIQKKIARKIETYFKGDRAVLFKALTLGTRRGLSPEMREMFFKTGTSHLLAISGLNISLIAGSLYLASIVAGFPQKMAAVLAFIVMILQVWIAGAGMPVARAGIMAGAGFTAVILNRERNSLNSFFLAYLVLLVLDTRSLENVSFQLSFLSVFALMVFMGNGLAEWQWTQGVAGSLAILAVTFPLTVTYFNSIAPVSIFANIAAVPFFNLALLTVLLAILSPVNFLSEMIARGAEFFLASALAWIRMCSLIPMGYFHVRSPTPAKLFFYYSFLLAFVLIKLRKWTLSLKWTGVLTAAWLAATMLIFWPVKTPEFRVTLFSAGRNEIASVDFSGVKWVVNTGRGAPSRQADWILIPYFRAQGVQKLSGILLSDFGQRHTGGLAALSKQFRPDYLLFPEAGQKPDLFRAQLPRMEKQGLHPGARISIKERGEIRVVDIVDGKMILTVHWGGRSFLFLPAVNSKIMEVLRKQRENLLSTDFLILPGVYAGSEKIAKEIILLLLPEAVSAPHLSFNLQTFLGESRIPGFSLEKMGGLEISLKKETGNLIFARMRSGI